MGQEGPGEAAGSSTEPPKAEHVQGQCVKGSLWMGHILHMGNTDDCTPKTQDNRTRQTAFQFQVSRVALGTMTSQGLSSSATGWGAPLPFLRWLR